MPLEDAPRRFTKQVHLRLHAALDPEKLQAIHELVGYYPGKCPLFLCFRRPSGEVVFIETHEKFFVAPRVNFKRLRINCSAKTPITPKPTRVCLNASVAPGNGSGVGWGGE